MNIVRKIHDLFRVKSLAGSTLQSPTSTSDSTSSGNTYITITGGSLGGGSLSEADRSKLNSIEQGAQVNLDAFSKVLLETTNRELEQLTTTSSSIIANIPSDTANIRLVGNYPIKVSLESVSLFNYNTVTTTGDIAASYNVSYNEDGNIVIDYVSGTLFSTTDIEIIRILHREETLATYNNTQFEYTESEGTITQFIIPYQGTDFSSILFCRYEISSSESTEGTETVRELSVITELLVSPTKQLIITLSDTNANYWKYEEDENGNRYLWTDCNVYSTKEVSAYGKAEEQEIPTILNLSLLQDVALTNLSNNLVLVYNASSQKWINIDANNLGISADNLKTLTITVNGTSYTYNPASSNQSINITTITLDDILPYISNKLDREEFFKWFTINYDSDNNVTSILANYDFYSIKGISAYGLGDIGGITRTTLQSLDDVSLSNLVADNMLAYNGSKWVNIPMSQVRGATSWADLENKPTTISGFGITDAYTKTEVNTKISEVSSKVTELSSSKADATIQVIAGDGLTGGGNLLQDITISLLNLNSTGTYYKVNVDTYGRVTSGISLLTIADILNLQTQLDSKLNVSDFNTWFTIIYNTDGTIKNIRANYDFYSVGEVSAYGVGDEEKKNYTTLAELNDVQLTNVKETDVLVYNGTKWVNVDQSTIKGALSWVDIQNKPTTLSGFGIVDAYTKTEIDNKLSPINSSINTINTNISDLSSSLSGVSTRLNNFLEGSDTDTIINKWKELEAFLAGYTQTLTLADLLSIKADKSTLDNYLPLDGGTMTGVITAATAAGTNGGILLGTTYLTSISGSTIFYKNNAIRFGTSTIWSYNDWAGLKYNTTEKTIYLGVPDNNIFGGKAINGTIKTPGITTIYVGDTNYVYHTGNLVVDWSKEIVINTPTTLEGYGITDGVNDITFTGSGNAITAVTISNHLLTFTKGETFLPKSTFDDLFEKVNVGTTSNPVYAIKAKYHLYSIGEVSAYEFGETGGTGASSLEELIDVQLTNLVADSILKYNGSKWVNIPITEVKGATSWNEIEDKPSTFTPSAHTHTVADITDISPLVLNVNGSSLFTYDGKSSITANLTVPTKVSQLTNDSGYLTAITKAQVEGVLTGNITSHTHSYLPLSGGTMTGQLYLTGLEEGNSDVTDNTELLTSYASNNGFNDVVGKVYRRDAIKVYNYIKGKLDSVYLPLSGGTMTGSITLPQNYYKYNNKFGINCNNSDIIGANSIYFGDTCDSALEGIQFYRTSTTNDSLWANTGVLYFSPNTTTGSTNSTNYTILHSGNYNSYAPTLTGAGASGTWGINISGNAATATNADTVDGIHESGFYRSSITTVDGETALSNIPAGRSGSYVLSHSGWTGAAHIFYAGSSNSTFGFVLPGGTNDVVQVISTTDAVPSRWRLLGQLAYLSSNVASATYATSAGNADTLDGVHNGNVTANYYRADGNQELNLNSLDANTWYPCVMRALPSNSTSIRVTFTDALSYHKPSWSTHPNGFSFQFDFEWIGGGWGTIPWYLRVHRYAAGYGGETACYGLEQRNNRSALVLYMRGGTSYYYRTTDGRSFTVYSTTTNIGDSTYPDNVYPITSKLNDCFLQEANSRYGTCNIASYADNATKLQTARTLWGQSFNGTANVSGAISNTGTITPSTTHTYNIGSSSLVYERAYVRYIDTDTNYYLRICTQGNEVITVTTDGRVGISTTSPSVKLHVAGDIAATGEVTAKASSSDIRLKTDISDYKALSIIRSHKSIKYHWNAVAKANADVFNDNYWHYGLIAQDVQRDMPQMVSDVFKDYLVINYERLIPICWKGLQEVDDEVTKLKKRVKQLEKRLLKYESTEVFYTKGND